MKERRPSIPLYPNINDEVLYTIAKMIGGDEAVLIVKEMSGSKEVTVEELAKTTEIRINTVRKVLYKLYSYSLVTSRRFRDPETGWFIFQWKLQLELVEGFVQNMKQKILKKLQTRLEHERSHEFYHCGNPDCPKVSFEDAMELIFRCPNCDGILRPFDNRKMVEALEREIEKIEKELDR